MDEDFGLCRFSLIFLTCNTLNIYILDKCLADGKNLVRSIHETPQ